MAGRLIVFEGIDGSGKSTQFKMLCERLSSESIDFRRVVFPRYDKPSSALVRMYLGGEFGSDPGNVNAYAASSFYAVDRFASFVQDWRDYYMRGGLVLTDRYTTSNALHQGGKLPPDERERFFNWLYEYEFGLIGLPRPDLTFYMNIDVPLAAERLAARSEIIGVRADIHEQNVRYLEQCAQAGDKAASLYGWNVVDCSRDSEPRSREDIHSEIFEVMHSLPAINK